MDVLVTGPIPTPAIAMLTRSMRCDLGVMISASHNPYDDNGIKLFGPNGFKLSDALEARDRGADRCRPRRAGSPARRRSAAPTASTASRTATSSSPSSRCRARCRCRDCRIVIDCANGAAYRVAPEALWELGAEVITARRRAGRPQHQPRRRFDRAEGARRTRCAKCAPISASRSTATPTASS